MKILLAGEGGQGVQSAAEILTYGAFLEGKKASFIPNFGVEQRGGVSVAFIVIGDEAAYPKFEKADILAIFCDRAIERIERYMDEKTHVFCGPSVSKEKVKEGWNLIESGDLPERVWNVLVVNKILGLDHLIDKESIRKVITEKLQGKVSKDPEILNLNYKALDA